MLTTLSVGIALSLATTLASAEVVRAYTPFVALSTGVMLLAYWVVAADHTSTRAKASVHKKAA
jgi:hypothetical protein